MEYNRLLCLKDYSNKDFMRTKKTSQLIIIENQSIYKNCLLSMQKKKKIQRNSFIKINPNFISNFISREWELVQTQATLDR